MSRSSSQSRKNRSILIQRADGEPLTRTDIQYDLLECIFSSTEDVFTDPLPTWHGSHPGSKVSFRELYVNALWRSPRASKPLREKMMDSEEFATDFAKLALLANVGKIGTTMAFFPELRTALRTYHPVPSLQRTDGSLQDVPRIRNILKANLLLGEEKSPPADPATIVALGRKGKNPPTSITNLLTVLSSHPVTLTSQRKSSQYGQADESWDFRDLFILSTFSSASRARVFLWTCFHYLDPLSPNPFADAYSRQYPDLAPLTCPMTQEEMQAENVDTKEELLLADTLRTQRLEFKEKKSLEVKAARSSASTTPGPLGESDHRAAARTRSAPSRARSPHAQLSTSDPRIHSTNPRSFSERVAPCAPGERPPHKPPYIDPPRDMLQHAWHVVSFADPLLDSDEELADEHVHLDYTKRLLVINRLRGKDPTPEAEYLMEYDLSGSR